MIGQCADRYIWKFLFDFFCDGIDKKNHGPGVGAFLLVDGCTFGAGAESMPVILGDRCYRRFGIISEAHFQVFHQFNPHRIIRQAKLGVCVYAFALDLAEPLWVLFKIRIGRNIPLQDAGRR